MNQQPIRILSATTVVAAFGAVGAGVSVVRAAEPFAVYHFNNRCDSTTPEEMQRVETIRGGGKVSMFIPVDKNPGAANAYVPAANRGERGNPLQFSPMRGQPGLRYDPFERDGSLIATGSQALWSVPDALPAGDSTVTFRFRFDYTAIPYHRDKMAVVLFSVSEPGRPSRLEAHTFRPSTGSFRLRYGKLDVGPFRYGRWYDIALRYRGNRVELILDGKTAGIAEAPHGRRFAFAGGLADEFSNNHQARYDDLKCFAP